MSDKLPESGATARRTPRQRAPLDHLLMFLFKSSLYYYLYDSAGTSTQFVPVENDLLALDAYGRARIVFTTNVL